MARPRSFEKREVLNTAMGLFWDRGYANTSLKDLARETELKPGSLYNVFEDKEKLFEEAMEHYVDTVIKRRLDFLDGDEPLERRIRKFLRDVADQSLQSNQIPGCLLTNTSLELSGLPDDQRRRLRENMVDLEDAFTRTLEEARDDELRESAQPPRLARFLVGLIQGMNVLGRAVPDEQRMDDLIESGMEIIQNHKKED